MSSLPFFCVFVRWTTFARFDFGIVNLSAGSLGLRRVVGPLAKMFKEKCSKRRIILIGLNFNVRKNAESNSRILLLNDWTSSVP